MHCKKINNESGAVTVVIAIFLIVLLGLAALAVDVGYVRVTRNESQNAADAAALAGARQLGENYYNNLTDPTTGVVSVAQNTAHQNKVAGLNLAETAGDNVITKIGTWDPTANPKFKETSVDPHAVQTEVRRQGGTANGPVDTFFAKIFKLIDPSSSDTVNVGAMACASLSGPCEGKPSIPLGIGKGWFDIHPGDDACGPKIKLNHTGDSCAGWTNLSMSDDQIQKQVENMFKGTQQMPEIIKAGSEVQFFGGTVTKILEAMLKRFNIERSKDGDGDDAVWTTYVVVYDAPCGQNPNKPYKVLGFAKLKITDVIPTGECKGVEAKVVCGTTEEVRGGCFNARTMGAIPNLVQ